VRLPEKRAYVEVNLREKNVHMLRSIDPRKMYICYVNVDNKEVLAKITYTQIGVCENRVNERKNALLSVLSVPTIKVF